MPELPEVETTRQGIAPYLVGHRIVDLQVRQPRLRWPIDKDLYTRLRSALIIAVERRGKYLILNTTQGSLLIHLGMSGSVRIVSKQASAEKHDHVDIILENKTCLRLHDPRRFGSLVWAGSKPETHPLLTHLGPEPLDAAFDGSYLYEVSRGRKVAIKNFLMNSHVVAGVGNIYANEALFIARIHPDRAAGNISQSRYMNLASCVKIVLTEAIRQGGTTLRDYVNGSGHPGQFRVQLQVYGRAGQPCAVCHRPIKRKRTGQRATYYCPNCQH